MSDGMIEWSFDFLFSENKKTFPLYRAFFFSRGPSESPFRASAGGLGLDLPPRPPRLWPAHRSVMPPVGCSFAHRSALPPRFSLPVPAPSVRARGSVRSAAGLRLLLWCQLLLLMPEGLEWASWRVYSCLSWNPGSWGWPCLRSIMSSGMGSVCLQSGHALQPRKSSSVALLVLTVMGCPHSGQFFARVLGCIFILLGPDRRAPPPAGVLGFLSRSSHLVLYEVAASDYAQSSCPLNTRGCSSASLSQLIPSSFHQSYPTTFSSQSKFSMASCRKA